MECYLVLNGHLRLVRSLHLCRYCIYSNNCTIVRYNNILTCGNPATRFGQFQGGIQQKYTMANYVVGVQLAVKDIRVFIVVMELSWKSSSWFTLHCCRATKYFVLQFTKKKRKVFNPLNAELNPICHLLGLLGDATIVVVSRLRVNVVGVCLYSCLRLSSMQIARYMPYCYLWPVCLSAPYFST